MNCIVSLMKYDVIIFDVDGTLWNACPTSAKGMNRALQKFGIPRELTSGEIESISGHPYEHGINLLFETSTLSQYPQLAQSLDDYERDAIEADGGTIYEGVNEGFKELSAHAKLYLVSNCQSWYMDSFILFSQLSNLLSGYDCHGTSGKTKGEMLTNIMRKYPNKHGVYLGDTEGDMRAAKTANIDFIGAGYGFGDVTGAKECFQGFTGIVDHILRSG